MDNLNHIYKDDINSNSSYVQSKQIICPKCGENSIINFNNYKILINECKNGHETDNILLDEYEKTQIIDLSKIICEYCKKNNMSKYNKFYRCYYCKINLCPSCKSNHQESHIVEELETQNFLCDIHTDSFTSYCKTCKARI